MIDFDLEARWVEFSCRKPNDGERVLVREVGDNHQRGAIEFRENEYDWWFFKLDTTEKEMMRRWEWLEVRPKEEPEPVVPLSHAGKAADLRKFYRFKAEDFIRDMRDMNQNISKLDQEDQDFANLSEMFRLQAELNEHLDASMIAVADEGDERDIAQWTQNLATAMQQELAELLDCVPWKWWANYQKYDRQNARVEIIDLFHFLISLAQLHGMTAQDVFETYKAKCNINHRRHESGYTEKDPDDCKRI
ncbi:MAG: dUTPase [Victivallaceae bacterium]|nr:dUTPase [Victivallaceae bacterium]